MTAELVKNIHWVGFVDWNVRDFHSFDTWRGATYNSYLVKDDKTAVIDAVKSPYVENLIKNIASYVELDKVNYVVCNHAEPDHAGGIGELLKHLPNATLLCNTKCRDALAGYFNNIDSWKIQIVANEETISLGKRKLVFINTPMVHWPESMFTYIPEDELLFSMDAFGQHIATSERFDDEYDLNSVLREAKSYYANIVTPYSKQVQSTLAIAANTPIKIIAPSHGLIWRSHVADIVAAYKKWSAGNYARKVLIIYDSMWESTTQIANEILNGVVSVSDGVDARMFHVRKSSLTEIATEMLDAAGVAIGSSTLNTQVMPQISAVLTYIRGLKFSPKFAVAFGSYGWGAQAVDILEKWIKETGWTSIANPIKSKFRPTPEHLIEAKNAGSILAKNAIEQTKETIKF
ncbi:MAG: FprA family A-type flavoprotein [Planctomycetaceae bacterium]|jgi:flavorubredoxin|nr:FprA family A-type flavoprotein [Planctomycetaceae bacterium]